MVPDLSTLTKYRNGMPENDGLYKHKLYSINVLYELSFDLPEFMTFLCLIKKIFLPFSIISLIILYFLTLNQLIPFLTDYHYFLITMIMMSL